MMQFNQCEIHCVFYYCSIEWNENQFTFTINRHYNTCEYVVRFILFSDFWEPRNIVWKVHVAFFGNDLSQYKTNLVIWVNWSRGTMIKQKNTYRQFAKICSHKLLVNRNNASTTFLTNCQFIGLIYGKQRWICFYQDEPCLKGGEPNQDFQV